MKVVAELLLKSVNLKKILFLNQKGELLASPFSFVLTPLFYVSKKYNLKRILGATDFKVEVGTGGSAG